MSPALLRQTDQKADASHFFWECRCPYCDALFLARKSDVLGGKQKSCGCRKRQHKRSNFRDYTGQTVNFLYVMKEVGVDKNHLVIWEAVCLYEGCGNVVHVTSEGLRKGRVSCNCKSRKDTMKRALERYKDGFNNPQSAPRQAVGNSGVDNQAGAEKVPQGVQRDSADGLR